VVRSKKVSEKDVRYAGIIVSAADFTEAIGYAKLAHADTIGAPKIPNITWEDIGGLSKIRASIVDTMQLPLERPDLFANGIKKRSGMWH
jgi:peroxin-6